MNRKTIVTLLWATALLTIITGCGNSGGGGGNPPPSDCDKPSGTAYVRLDEETGTSGIYNTNALDPLGICQTKGAVISKVTNTSGSNISLAHGGVPFIILNNGQSTAMFNGRVVEGNWSAQYSGNVNEAPEQISITVDWSKP